jgi:20S proteasome alpha/beta subunit
MSPTERRNSLPSAVVFLIICSLFSVVAGSSIDGRYSFSLTTFDPSGKLGQVERAMEAASLGTPIVAVVKDDDQILLASPQVLPSVFMLDDGTARFASAAPHIVVAHSGISADGRVLVAAAQRLAVEHAYTFEEPIPIDLFLEEMSLLFQEYTMKPASRPFGATLLVAHLPPVATNNERKPQLFRIDASGAVTILEDNVAVINGRFSPEIESKLLELSKNSENKSSPSAVEDDELQSICRILQESMVTDAPAEKESEKASLPSSSIIGASFTRQGGFALKRFRSSTTKK